jgi:hypothetical protein
MILVAIDWREMTRNTLRGFCRVQMPAGIVLHDVAIHMRDGRSWASPPGRPVIGQDGMQRREAGGKAQFAPTITFASRADADQFSAAVIDAVRKAFPKALP